MILNDLENLAEHEIQRLRVVPNGYTQEWELHCDIKTSCALDDLIASFPYLVRIAQLARKRPMMDGLACEASCECIDCLIEREVEALGRAV